MEPTSCPTLTKSVYTFDHGDPAKMAPIAEMYTLGHGFMPPGIHAGGLRYHGAAPLVSSPSLGVIVPVRADASAVRAWLTGCVLGRIE